MNCSFYVLALFYEFLDSTNKIVYFKLKRAIQHCLSSPFASQICVLHWFGNLYVFVEILISVLFLLLLKEIHCLYILRKKNKKGYLPYLHFLSWKQKYEGLQLEDRHSHLNGLLGKISKYFCFRII